MADARWLAALLVAKATRVAAGLCIDCGREARPDRMRCVPCGARANTAQLARYHQRNAGRRRVIRCGLCKTTGHNRQRCGVA